MTISWEDRFASWAQPPGSSEADRIENAITAVRRAVDADDSIAACTRVFLQGSYRNRVNVRQDSDVDIGVLYTGNAFFATYPAGKTRESYGNEASGYSYASFKNALEGALVRHFGRSAVTRGRKAFDIHANSYRVDADVVPVFEYRRYGESGSHISGVKLIPDAGGPIVNWPERLYDDSHWLPQHYENGVSKNAATSRGFKGVVRILKKLRYELADQGVRAARATPGFVVECLAWNAPNASFAADTWDRVLQAVLLHIWANTRAATSCDNWTEVNDLKYLFRGSPPQKLTDAHEFISMAWDFIGIRP